MKGKIYDRLLQWKDRSMERARSRSRANGHRLFFHAFYRKKDDGGKDKNRPEVDFLIKRGNKVSAIEVKTGRSTVHGPLDYVMDTYSEQLGQCYVLHMKDLRKDGDLLYIPIYMAICLRGLFRAYVGMPPHPRICGDRSVSLP